MTNPIIVITGPTATGKTKLAAELAAEINAEIISADSRQVYRGMDIGSGKDLADYVVDGLNIPVHLVDIVDPGYEYNLYEYQRDFLQAYHDITEKGKPVILCGGTGRYIETVLGQERLLEVPHNKDLRLELDDLTHEELVEKLKQLRPLHNTTDITERERLIRALEIELYQQKHSQKKSDYPKFNSFIFAITAPRPFIRERITERLKIRLQNGMISEIESLLKTGLKPEQLIFYGLEYRYLTQYIIGEITYDQMFEKLNTAIHQFAKRQMTWFRGMERRGFELLWIDASLNNQDKMNILFNGIA